MGDTVESFRLFPLGLVLLPREKLPLHIFEERYRTMIGECLEDELEFGVLWMSDDGLREVGCTARIEQVLEQFDDGRVNILVEGSRPFRMLRRIETLPYPAGDVELLDDADEKDTPAAAAEARVRYGDLVERVTDTRPEPKDLDGLDAYGMAATLDVALDEKQSLLEQRSERARLEQLETLFEGALERIKLSEKAAERSKSNGSMRS